MNPVVQRWQQSLSQVLRLYEARRGPLPRFLPALFAAFVAVNLACFWWAMFTAFPEATRGRVGMHYFKVSFPVGFLGALFDSLSFFVTVTIIRHALRARSNASYLGHLAIDVGIAILASFWVIFVFSVSGWLVSHWEARPQDLASRGEIYEDRVRAAFANPLANWRNIYFGLVMGFSAMLPTLMHVALSIKSFLDVRRLARGAQAAPID